MRRRAEQGYPMRNAPNAPTFEAIDRDGDGQVGPDEFRSALDSHHRRWMGWR
jgi:hypothetical protein